MKTITIGTSVNIYDDPDELQADDAALLHEAGAALGKSYSPYSGFKVGAAAVLDNGAVVSAANQENAAYPLCLCAEMALLGAVSSAHPSAIIHTLAITVKSGGKVVDMPVSPCGACRQTIVEVEHRQGQPIRILLRGEVGAVYELASAQSLLPLSFDGGVL